MSRQRQTPVFHQHPRDGLRYTMEDAQRFCVTTKSNGENGKYTFRKIFGDWYAFAGSKNTGNAWKLGADVSKLLLALSKQF